MLYIKLFIEREKNIGQSAPECPFKMRSSALNTMFTLVLKASSATTAMHKLVLNCTIVISK